MEAYLPMLAERWFGELPYKRPRVGSYRRSDGWQDKKRRLGRLRRQAIRRARR